MTKADDCKPLIKACDAALAQHKTYEAAQDKAFQDSMAALSNANVSINDKNQELASIWHNPWFTGSLGALAAITTFELLHK